MTEETRRGTVLIGVLLFVVTVLAYIPALSAGFVWDDDAFLTENPLIHAADGLGRFWFSREPPDYFPLTSSMLWIEWRLWGANAMGYHAVNIALHAASVVLLWRVLKRLAVPAAWFGALLFAVHPVNVESVAWITERKNTLPMALALGSVLVFLRHEDDERPGVPWGALALFVAALLAKTNVVMVPVLFLILAWWRRGGVTRQDVKRTAPFLAASFVLGLVTVWYQGANAIGDAVVRADGLGGRLATAGRAVWFYVGQAVYPADTCFVYERWPTDAGLPPLAEWTGVAALLIAAVALVVAIRCALPKARGVAAATAIYCVLLLPVLGFVDIYFMRFSLVADHWQYAALPAFCAVSGAGLHGLWGLHRHPRFGTIGSAVILTALLGWLTWQRAATFENETTLWRATLACNEKAWLAHYRLGVISMEHGDLESSARHFEDAIRVRVEPYPRARFALGRVCAGLRRYDEAEGHFRAVLDMGGERPAAVHNELGSLHVKRGSLAKAAEEFERALAIEPDKANTHHNYAQVLLVWGRLEDALRHADDALRLRPDFEAARVHRQRIVERMRE
jgi:protein O-mannosyl-transferase